MIWISAYLSNSYVEILMPNIMVLGGGASGRCLNHESGAPHKWGFMSSKRDTRELPSPFHHVRTQRKGTIYEPESPHQTPNLLAAWSWTSQKQISVVSKLPRVWYCYSSPNGLRHQTTGNLFNNYSPDINRISQSLKTRLYIKLVKPE